MSPDIMFIIIFGLIILGAIAISYIVLAFTRKTRVVHIYKYKTSKDYARLYELVVEKGVEVCVMDPGSRVFRYDSARRSELDEGVVYISSEKFYINKGRDAFIGLCTYKGFEFFDPVDEVK